MTITSAELIVQNILAHHPDAPRSEVEAWVNLELDAHHADQVRIYTPLLVTQAVDQRVRLAHPSAHTAPAA